MKIRKTLNSVSPARMCATVAICAALSACGGGSGGGDITGELDENGVPLIGGGGDEPIVVDPLIDELAPDFIADPVDVLAAGCAAGDGTDVDSSTSSWGDNCLIQQFTNATSSYAQGIQRIVFCRGFTAGNDNIEDFADGQFGTITQDQVEAFQMAEGVPADGSVGPLTWAALEAVLVPINPEDFRTTFGVAVPEGAACEDDVQFFQTFIPDETGVTGENTGWTMAQTPGSLVGVPFSIGPPQPVE